MTTLNATQKLIVKALTENESMTSRQLGEQLGITHHAVNMNIKFMRAAGVHIYIKAWDMTGGRGRPVHAISEKPRRDKPEPKRKPDSWYRKRLYQKRVAYERARARSYYKPASPWDVLLYADARNAA